MFVYCPESPEIDKYAGRQAGRGQADRQIDRSAFSKREENLAKTLKGRTNKAELLLVQRVSNWNCP